MVFGLPTQFFMGGAWHTANGSPLSDLMRCASPTDVHSFPEWQPSTQFYRLPTCHLHDNVQNPKSLSSK